MWCTFRCSEEKKKKRGEASAMCAMAVAFEICSSAESAVLPLFVYFCLFSILLLSSAIIIIKELKTAFCVGG
jgi:hypothetical protein